MRILKIDKCCISDGPGIRLSIYCSGCNLCCELCHNKKAWDNTKGELYNKIIEDNIIKELSKSYYRGVTFCGGEPTMNYNINDFTQLAKRVREELPQKDIWLYTGKEWKDIKDLEIVNYIDVAVVGPFIYNQRDITVANQ